MSGRRLDWRKVRFIGRKTLSLRDEVEFRSQDRAQRWLNAVERNQRERRSHSLTAASSPVGMRSTR
jgi:hypothetical protein